LVFLWGLSPPREGEKASPPPGALGPASPVLPGAEESPGAAHGLFRVAGAPPLSAAGQNAFRSAGNLNTGPIPHRFGRRSFCPALLRPGGRLSSARRAQNALRFGFAPPPGHMGKDFFLSRFSTKFSSCVENPVSILPLVYLCFIIFLYNNTKSLCLSHDSGSCSFFAG
jgi:hypothetical protein